MSFELYFNMSKDGNFLDICWWVRYYLKYKGQGWKPLVDLGGWSDDKGQLFSEYGQITCIWVYMISTVNIQEVSSNLSAQHFYIIILIMK